MGRREWQLTGTQHGALKLEDRREENREKEKEWVEGNGNLLVPSMAPSN